LSKGETNKDYKEDKLTRVDLLVKNTKGELIIIEIQNNREHDYLLRILFGTSKILLENMDEGMKYSEIKKVISVNIVYFDLGQGEDYIYHGTTSFIGLNNKDTLQLSHEQQLLYKTEKISKLYPEYYVIKVNQFNDVAKNTLDEWIYFLKKEEIKDEFKAKGLKQAKEELNILKLSELDRKEYEHFIEQVRYEESLIVSNYRVGKEETKIEIAQNSRNEGLPVDIISKITGLSIDEINNLK
jgi:predicted transposase/invertase (TIGR01784 family)